MHFLRAGVTCILNSRAPRSASPVFLLVKTVVRLGVGPNAKDFRIAPRGRRTATLHERRYPAGLLLIVGSDSRKFRNVRVLMYAVFVAVPQS